MEILRHTGNLTIEGEQLDIYRMIIQINDFDCEITKLENSKIGLDFKAVPTHLCYDGKYRVPEKYVDHHKLVSIDKKIRSILKERDELFMRLRFKTDKELREERLEKIINKNGERTIS